MSSATDPREDALERALRAALSPAPADESAAARVLARLDVLPPQKARRFAGWPRLLLDWDFAPAWPRLAALACSVALGFAVGLTGLDRQLSRTGTSYAVASGADFTSAISEPEPLTGLRP